MTAQDYIKQFTTDNANGMISYVAIIQLMEGYAKEYHESEINKLNKSAVSGAKRKLVCPHCKTGEENFTRNGHHIWCRNCDYEFNVG